MKKVVISTKIFPVIRILIGSIFVISGYEKLINPIENFVYVIQGYDILRNGVLEYAVAGVFPWSEFLLGGFLILGLWSRLCLSGLFLMNMSFIVVVGQAILRNLPITECGCFGDLITVPLPVIILVDAVIGIFIVLLLVFRKQTSHWCLDRYFLSKD